MKKVAIVGVEGSGKTVMLAGLGDLYTYPDADGYFLVPKNFGTAAYVAEKIQRMRKGEWPSATAGDEMQGLDWALKRRERGVRRPPETVCEVSFLDFAGEVYRTAFGIGGGDAAVELQKEAEKLKAYVREADDLLVLINLRDVIVNGLGDRRVQEAMWITNSILEAALAEEGGRKAPRAAIVLSQADSYAETIKACGGASGVLEKHLPYVANNYGWLDVFEVNAVDKTVLDDGGNSVPAPDFTTKGLLPILNWIRGEGVSGGGRGATALPGSDFTGGSRLARPSGGVRLSRPSESAEALKAGDVKTISLPGGVEMRMRWCPPGTFTMGSPKSEEGRGHNETLHQVTLTKGFWLGETSVTQRQWTSVMGDNPSTWRGDNLPVETISWDDCQSFIQKVNARLDGAARLPTEAEWEYACRAGTATAYFWGYALNGDRANCDGNYPYGTKQKGPYVGKPTPGGTYGANAWGFLDMHGNVWEWCEDWYDDYCGDVADPTGPDSGSDKVLRGGGWSSSARNCRSAHRGCLDPGNRNFIFGFRLACSEGPHFADVTS